MKSKDKGFVMFFREFPSTKGTNQRKKLPIRAWWNSRVRGTYIRKLHGEIKL